MSLINKMLQDLDARGGQPGPAAVSPEIKPVPPPERAFPWLRAGLLGALLAVLGASGYLAWKMERGAAPAVPAAPAEVPVSLAGGGPAAPAAAPAPALSGEAATQQEAVPTASAPPRAEQLAAESEPAAEPVRKPIPEPIPAPPAAAPAARKTVAEPARRPVRAPAPGIQARPAAAPAAGKPAKGRSETDMQRADNAYRRALASLDDGRVTEAIARLQEALRANPRHETARQTLVSLLIEAQRPDEAMRQLGAALALDPAQPAMAMLLGRLQLERGSPGVDTLLRTLPYATGNADYRGFLAGALQREERHREAVEQYLAALRLAPRNGVWWMGLGISLQAEKRSQEAAGAYQKALDSGVLSTELQAFVERKLKQLAR